MIKVGGAYVLSETYDTFICQESVGRQDTGYHVYFQANLKPLSITIIELQEFSTRDLCILESPL